jgi:hypothetical protein
MRRQESMMVANATENIDNLKKEGVSFRGFPLTNPFPAYYPLDRKHTLSSSTTRGTNSLYPLLTPIVPFFSLPPSFREG